MYLVLKALHIIAVVCWFAALFYLPRLFVYYTESDEIKVKEVLRVMQRKLYKYIGVPSAYASFFFGIAIILMHPETYLGQVWLQLKILLILFLLLFHLQCGRYVKLFQKGVSVQKTSRYFRIFNEVPTIILLSVVFLAVLKPF